MTSARNSTAPERRPCLVAAPDSLPPFDDERTPVRRTRTLTPVPPRARPAAHARTPVASDPLPERRETRDDLPPADRAAAVLARALVEVLTGRRPVRQLRAHCAAGVFAGLERRTQVTAGPSVVRAVRVGEPADGVAEVAVVVRSGHRGWALAFRLERIDSRWRITALETA